MTNKCKILVVSLSLLALALSVGCDLVLGVFCTTSIEPAIVIEVRDASTDVPIADKATGYVRDGAYIDTLQAYVSDSDGKLYSFRAANERAGTYEILVQRVGFSDWRKTNIVVCRGTCHVRTVRVVALMDSL